MKLYYAPTSPYSRKVRVTAIEEGLADKIEFVVQMPWENTNDFHSINPLGRIPVLQTDDGESIHDSTVICEYLDSIGRGGLIPGSGPERWRALRGQAIGDGLLDALVPWRLELMRPEESRSSERLERWHGTVTRTLRVLDAGATEAGDDIDIADIALGCALGYMDLRFPDWDWRKDYGGLAAWFETLSARPSFRETAPS